MFSRMMICLTGVGLMVGCKSGEDYLSEGQGQRSLGYDSVAIFSFKNAIRLNPFLKDAYIEWGQCHENLHQENEAVRVYEQLLNLYPDNTTAYYYTGICKYRQNKFTDAIDFFNKAIKTKGGFHAADTTTIQAIIDLNKDNFEIESSETEIPMREIIFDRGMAYYKAGQMKNARDDFASCIIQKFNSATSLYMLGICIPGRNSKIEWNAYSSH